MTGRTTTTIRAQQRESRRKAFLPLAVGIAVTILAAVFNHFLFLRAMPSAATGVYETAAIIRDGGSAPEAAGESAGVAEGVMSILANLALTLDDWAVDVMRFLYLHGNADGISSTEDQVAVVTIDDASLNKIGSWPWSRRYLADILAKLESARVVGFDTLFHEPDRTSLRNYINLFESIYGETLDGGRLDADLEQVDNDIYFGRMISNAETVLGAFFFNDPSVEDSPETLAGTYRIQAVLPNGSPADLDQVAFRCADDVLVNCDGLRTSGRGPRGEGFVNLFLDETGVVRSIPLFVRRTDGASASVFPSLPLEMVRLGLGADLYIVELTGDRDVVRDLVGEGDSGIRYAIRSVILAKAPDKEGGKAEELLTIPLDEYGGMAANALPRIRNFRIYPAWEILDGIHEGAFAGKYILFDITAAGVGGVRSSVFSARSVPTAYVHATMLGAMLRRGFFSHSFRFDYLWQQASIVVAGAAVSFGLFYGGHLASLLVFVGVILCLTVGNYLVLFRNGLVAGLAMPVLAALVVLFIQFLVNHLVMGRDRRFIREAFSLNVSPGILDYLENNPHRLKALAGENRGMTVLFSDIRGFTAISEQMTAPDLARFLNEYLTPMSDLVMQNLGTVDKFMGDAIMAFWNAPTEDPDHARNAARCALAMQARLEALQAGWSRRGLPRLAIGCGINTGPMFAGYMGSEQRKNYTVMGDNVNIASRLEGLNKIYSSGIVISQTTREALGPAFFCRVIDKVRVSGRHGPIVIYELIGEGIPDEGRSEEIAAFERVFELYQKREFQAAESLLRELIFISPQPIYDMYLDRLAVYNALPPPPDWDGVFSVTRK